MKASVPLCPVCEGEIEAVEVPGHSLYCCVNPNCEELVQQLQDGRVVPMGNLLRLNALGDDRVKAAISQPRVTTVASFLEIFDNAMRAMQMELASASGGLRTVLAQIENRLDYGIQQFTGLDFASKTAEEGLRALREARDLVSTLPKSKRGVRDEAQHVHGSSTE